MGGEIKLTGFVERMTKGVLEWKGFAVKRTAPSLRRAGDFEEFSRVFARLM